MSASALGFLFHVVTARVYTTEVYAWLVLAWGGCAFGVLGWRACIGVPFVVDFSSSEGEDRERVAATLFHWTRVAQSVFLGAALGVGTACVLWSEAPDALPLVPAAFLLCVALYYRESWRHLLIASLYTTRLGMLGFVSAFTALVALLVVGSSGADAWIALLAIGAGVSVGTVFIRPRWAGRGEIVPGALQRWWKFGKHVLVGVLSTTGATQVVLWMLLVHHGEDSVAILGAAVALIGLPRPVLGAITAILTPTIARQQASGGGSAEWSPRVAFLSIVVGVAFVAVVVPLAPLGWVLLFPAVPAAPTLVVAMLALMVVMEGANALFKGFFRGLGRPHLESQATVVGALVGLTVAFLTIPTWGAIGAATALMGTQFLTAIVALAAAIVLRREPKVL